MDTSYPNITKVLELIQLKMQKYLKNESSGEIFENPDYNSLYEIVSFSKHRVVILEK